MDKFGQEVHFVRKEEDSYHFTLRYPGNKYNTERFYDHPENHLFIITPEPELSKFEDAAGLEIFDPPFNEEQIKVIKEESAKLLELARKEIEDELKEKVFHDYWKQVSDRCIQARKEGKAEALKDLPRWKKAARAYLGDRLPKIDHSLNRVVARDENGAYYLTMDDLYKLPKEEEQ